MGKDSFQIGLNNFRIFKNLENFNIAPITLLIGPNNSGKTSFINALSLLQANFGNPNPEISHLKFGYSSNSSTFSQVINRFSEGDSIELIFRHFDIGDQKGEFDHDFYNSFLQDDDTIMFGLRSFENRFNYIKDGSDGILKSFKVFINSEKKKLLDISANGESYSFTLDLDVSFFFPSIEDLEDFPGLNDFLDEEVGVLEEERKETIIRYTYTNLQELNKLSLDIGEVGRLFKKGSLSSKTSFRNPIFFTGKESKKAESKSTEEQYAALIARKITEDFIESFMAYFFGHMEIDFLNLAPIKELESKDKWILEPPDNTIKLGSITKKFLENWLQKFQIGESLLVKDIEEELQLFYVKQNNHPMRLKDMGEGAQKITHILLELVKQLNFNHYSSKTFLISEPEKGLHPKLQSLFADFIVDLKKKFNANFIIETHSEYLIRKLQVLIAKNEFAPSDAVINYFKSDHNLEKNEKRVYPINFLKDGRLDKEFGPGFYDETTELMKEHFMTLKSN